MTSSPRIRSTRATAMPTNPVAPATQIRLARAGASSASAGVGAGFDGGFGAAFGRVFGLAAGGVASSAFGSSAGLATGFAIGLLAGGRRTAGLDGATTGFVVRRRVVMG